MKPLVNEFSLIFSPSLSKHLGLKQAIFLQQLHYWIVKKIEKDPENPKSFWVYNTAKQWCEQLPFLSEKSFWRLISSLKKKNLLLVSNQNRLKFDKTNWYSLHYQNLHSLFKWPLSSAPSSQPTASSQSPKSRLSSNPPPPLFPTPLVQIDPSHLPPLTPPIPETNPKTTHPSISLSIPSPSPTDFSLPPQEPSLKKPLEEKNVFLSKSQVVFLLKKYSKTLLRKFIKKLSLYKWSSGKKYACDFAAILNWVAVAVLKEEKTASRKPSSRAYKLHPNQRALKRYLEMEKN